jgi:DNA-binding PucR family transcriptional regulator
MSDSKRGKVGGTRGTAANTALGNHARQFADEQRKRTDAERKAKEAEGKRTAKVELDRVLDQIAKKVDACFKANGRPSEDAEVLALILVAHELKAKL